jgi:hypothetical protein
VISSPKLWKKDLTRLADKLQRRGGQKRWTASSTAAFEKEVFIGAFVVRKLMDSGHVSRGISARAHQITLYPIRDPSEIEHKIKHFTHRYHMMRGEKTNLTLRNLMDQLIQSYHFSPFVPVRKGMVGIFFASDLAQRNRLYYFPLPKLVEVFRNVGKDRPAPQSDAERSRNRTLYCTSLSLSTSLYTDDIFWDHLRTLETKSSRSIYL